MSVMMVVVIVVTPTAVVSVMPVAMPMPVMSMAAMMVMVIGHCRDGEERKCGDGDEDCEDAFHDLLRELLPHQRQKHEACQIMRSARRHGFVTALVKN